MKDQPGILKVIASPIIQEIMLLAKRYEPFVKYFRGGNMLRRTSSAPQR